MKRWIAVIALSGIAAGGASAQTIDAKKANELMGKAACNACHSVDKKGVGPAYNEVAKKYKGDAKAPDLLAGKVRKGGQGTWGPVPMPPNAPDKISDDEVKQLVAWILSL